MSYRVEISPNNRAGCQATHCKQAEGGPIKIQKGEIRQGVSVTIQDHTSMKYRHWGCVTPAVIHNWHETSGGDMDLVDGYDELPADAQEKVKRALEQGHVDDDDWNGDLECNRWNGKKQQGMFLKGNAKKKAEEGDEEEDDEKSNKKKRSAEVESDDEKKPAAKKARATESAEADDAAPAKKGRGRPKKATTATPTAADEDGDAAPKRGRGRPRKSVANDAAATEQATDDTPKRGRGRPRKPRPLDENGNEIEPPAKVQTGPKRGRGRPRKSVPAEDAAENEE